MLRLCDTLKKYIFDLKFWKTVKNIETEVYYYFS